MNTAHTTPTLTPAEVAEVLKPLRQASLLPMRAYSSPAFFQDEMETAFRPNWHVVGRAEALAEPGAYLTADIVGEPVLVLRDKDGTLRAMSNACRHRGAPLLKGTGVARAMACPYHAWSYNLDGTLRGAPHMGQVDGFDRRSIRLPQFPVEVWNGFVFVSLNPEAEPLGPKIAGLTDALAPFELDRWTTVDWQEIEVDWNWKVSLENFSEAYHHIAVHKDTIGKVSPAENVLYEETNTHYSLFYVHVDPSALEAEQSEFLPHDAHDRPFPGVPGLPPKLVSYSPVFNIYPTFHVVLASNFGLWMRLNVKDVDRHTMSWSWLLPPGAKDLPDVGERLKELEGMFVPVVAEDLSIMPMMKANERSRVYTPGRYCDQEIALHQLHRWLLQHMIAAGRLRVGEE